MIKMCLVFNENGQAVYFDDERVLKDDGTLTQVSVVDLLSMMNMYGMVNAELSMIHDPDLKTFCKKLSDFNYSEEELDATEE